MTKRKVLDISSVKKRDTITGWPDSETSGEASYVPGTFAGGRVSFLWCPTIRGMSAPNISSRSTRNSQDVFWKGISEKWTVRSSGSDPYRWRRIVIELPQIPPQEVVVTTNYVRTRSTYEVGGAPPDSNVPFGIRGTPVYGRPLNALDLVSTTNFQESIFAGVSGTDWWDPMTAKVDSKLFTVMSDNIITVRSGNDAGTIKTRKFWMGLNKTMTYADQEVGSTMGGGAYTVAAQTVTGLKNVFVYDLIEPLPGSSDVMLFGAEATLYWHEK